VIRAGILPIILLAMVSLLTFAATSDSSAATQMLCRNGILNADSKSPTTLFGTIRGVGVWGPPNFGEHPETDRWDVVWVLDLDGQTFVNIGAETTGQIHRTREVQLLSPKLPFEDFEGVHVRVEGTLEEATAHAVTDAVLETTAIKKVPRARGSLLDMS
jgi:hypothetical protein